jgi:hypothetical protein
MEQGKIEKPFYATLPVFVKFADEEPAAKDVAAAGTPSEPPPPPESLPPPPPAPTSKGKGKGKGKGKQLSLLE